LKDMREMRVKELLGLAAQGVVLPGDQPVDDILAQADRVRRRRRIAMAAASAAAVVAVGVGTALLPEPGHGAPATGYAAPPPAILPGTVTEAPATTGTTLSTTTGATATASPTHSAAPTGSAPTTAPATAAPRTTAPTTGARTSATGATGTTSRPPTSTSSTPGKSPAQVVAALLGGNAGDVRKETAAGTAAATSNPLSGRYAVTRNGRTGYLDVVVYDPKAVPGQTGRSVAEETAYNYCADNNTDAPNTDCATTPQGDGAVFKSWTIPAGTGTSGSQDAGARGYGASYTYPDGRGVRVTASAGTSGAETPAPEPPLGKPALSELVRETGWFTS
jgi:hypothetical protein